MVPSGGKPNANYKKRLEVNFKREILMERGINMKELEDTFVMEEIGRLEWHTFITMRNQCNELMVREFYAAMIPSVFEQGGPVFVRGKNVYINPKDINDWLGTKSYPEFEDGYQNKNDYKMYNLNLAKVIQDNPSPRWHKGKKLTQRQLGFRQHFWNIFFSYSLIPAKHRNSVSLEMAIILHCMSKKLKFDVGTLIHRRMVEIGKKKSTVLAFPCLITHFMEKAKLRVDDPADGIRSPRTCGRKAYNEAAGPRGVLKLPTCADQIAEKRRLEKEAAAAEGGEDSEEVESEDLEDSDNPEDETQRIRKLVQTLETMIVEFQGFMRSNHYHKDRGNRYD